MPCKNKKCKKPVLVVLSNSFGGGISQDFLESVGAAAMIRNKFYFIFVNTQGDWVSSVKERLKCLCKKYGRRASIISTLFDTDLELKFAQLENLYDRCYTTSSSDAVLKNTLQRVIFLPITDNKIYRTNDFYRALTTNVIPIPLYRSDSNKSYNNQVTQKVLLENQIYDVPRDGIIEEGTFATDILPEHFTPEFLFRSNGLLYLSDSSAFNAVVAGQQLRYTVEFVFDPSGSLIRFIDANDNIVWEATLANQEFPFPEAFLLQAGLKISYNNTLSANQAFATGIAVSYVCGAAGGPCEF